MSQLTEIEVSSRVEEDVMEEEQVVTQPRHIPIRKQIVKPVNVAVATKDNDNKGFFKLPTFSLVTLGFAFLYFGIVYVCYSLVSGGEAGGINMFVPVGLGFAVAFEIQYVVMIRNNRHFQNKEWNLDKIIWNCFVILLITSATGITIFFMMLKSKGMYFFNDFVNNFNDAQLAFFIIMICFYFFLCAMIVWHIIVHRKLALTL